MLSAAQDAERAVTVGLGRPRRVFMFPLPENPSNFQLSIHFFLQLAVILLACRIVGWMARRIGQPQVVGEMICGVLLGPSLLGAIAPNFSAQLFPPHSTSMTILYIGAQLGLVLYMFCVGLEFRGDLLRQKARSAIFVSVSGMVVPFALGAAIAVWLADDHRLFAEKMTTAQGILFMGAAMSITAFPMLARIIYEGGLSNTHLGTLALAAGSCDDACAWCALAIVVAWFSGDPSLAIMAVGGGVAYALMVLLGVRPFLARLGANAEKSRSISATSMAIVMTLLMTCAWITDGIGIYAVFGAFILGAAMPRGFFSKELQRLIEPVTTTLLLPMFFVYSGLNTKMGLVDSPFLWAVAMAVLAAACLGKGVACWSAARLSGEPNRDAVAIGSLMNARGLMELILLNIGLEHGIITPGLFSIMVFMAIVTTLSATPMFELVLGKNGSPKRLAYIEANDRRSGEKKSAAAGAGVSAPVHAT